VVKIRRQVQQRTRNTWRHLGGQGWGLHDRCSTGGGATPEHLSALTVTKSGTRMHENTGSCVPVNYQTHTCTTFFTF